MILSTSQGNQCNDGYRRRFFPFQMQENPFQDRGNRRNRGNNAKNLHFRIRKSSSKFHIKVRKPHFKLRRKIKIIKNT